jgi:hypothetical protein
MMNNVCHSSSFGCHVADGDVAPGFHFRYMSGGGEVSLPCPRRPMSFLSHVVVLCVSEMG